MCCPFCRQSTKVAKRGFFRRKTGPKRRVQRYRCGACGRFFSDQTHTLTYRERKPHLDQPIFIWLCSGVSQRRVARNLGIHRITLARKLVRLGSHAAYDHRRDLERKPRIEGVAFDEMETFEHTKCKPLSIALAVDDRTRRVICARVASMPAKGMLAALSRRRYGKRADGRPKALRELLGTVRRVSISGALVKSDESPRYPSRVRSILPRAIHRTYKGRRGCVVGQGELKRGGFDPLFSLNHTAAMNRDNLKTLSRRTWCTAKRPDRLQALVNLYVRHHNESLDAVRKPRIIGRRAAK